jgi:hypothetical protein
MRCMVVMMVFACGGAKSVGSPPEPTVAIIGNEGLVASSLHPSQIVVTISQRYFAGMQDCYAKVLARAPALAGELALELAVTPTGEGASKKITAFDNELASCVDRQVPSWKFPIPRDGDGNPAEATFAITFRFEPGGR